MREMHSGCHGPRSWTYDVFSRGFSLQQRAACAWDLNLVSRAPIPSCLLSLEERPPAVRVQALGEVSGREHVPPSGFRACSLLGKSRVFILP